MECREVRELADSFLSEELLTETNHEILRHLDSCRSCRAEIDARRSLRASVRTAFGRVEELQSRPAFVSELRATLRDSAGVAPPRRLSAWGGWWAMAATLVLAAGIGSFWVRDWIAMAGSLARAAVGDHENCALHFALAEKPIPLEEADAGNAVYRLFEQIPPSDVITDSGPAHVLARHVCIYEGRTFVHVVLSYQGQPVSLLVTTAGGSRPLALQTSPHMTAGSRIDDMAIASLQAPGHLVYLVGAVRKPI